MQTFLDGNNRKWQLNIKIGSIKRVKDATNVDLSTFPECVKQLSDIFVFCQVLWQLIGTQAETANVTEQDFYDSLDGECLDNAFQMFMEEMVNFSPPQKRTILRKLIMKATEHERTVSEIVEKKIEELDLMKSTQEVVGNS